MRTYHADGPHPLLTWTAADGWDGAGVYIVGAIVTPGDAFRPYYIGQSGSSVRRRVLAFEHAVRHGDHRVPSIDGVRSGGAFDVPDFAWAYRKGCTHGPRASLRDAEREALASHVDYFLSVLHVITIPTVPAEAEPLERLLGACIAGHIAEIAAPASDFVANVACGPVLSQLFASVSGAAIGQENALLKEMT